VITVLTTDPDPRGWPFLLVAARGIGFEVLCLADTARASQVRNPSKRTWAPICLIQTPLGGILYRCIGRIGSAPPPPPKDTRSRSTPLPVTNRALLPASMKQIGLICVAEHVTTAVLLNALNGGYRVCVFRRRRCACLSGPGRFPVQAAGKVTG
jgi:hypothetical protein